MWLLIMTMQLVWDLYDEGKPNCAFNATFDLGRFACVPGACDVNEEGISTICRLQPRISNLPVTCNEDGTINIPINTGRTLGDVTFSPDNVVTSTETAPYVVAIDPSNCQPVNFTVTDEADCDITPILTINSPASIAGGITVDTNAPDWGVQIPFELGACGTETAVTGSAAILNDGDTAGGQLTDFCEPSPPEQPGADICSQIEGKIALIDRGQCQFTHKVENAQNCGAIGVVICNCQPGPGWCAANGDFLLTMAAGDLTNEITIPAVFMLYSDCQAIKAEINNGNDVEICIGAPGTILGCAAEFTVDVCDDYSTVTCDDGDCSTENDVATVDASGTEICACAGTPTQCQEGQTFNTDTCICEEEGDAPCDPPQSGTFDCEEE